MHVKMDVLPRIVSFWDGLFGGAFAVIFRECKCFCLTLP